MLAGLFLRKILGVASLCSFFMVSVSWAIPITFSSITMEVRSTANLRVSGSDDATSLLARFNSGAPICTVAVQEFTNIGGKQNCGTAAHADLATLYTINYFLGSGTALFQLGADWGLGGIIIGADGGDIVRTDDIWWANSWTNADVIDFTVSGAGYGTFKLLGFESCCSGNNSLRYDIVGDQRFSAAVVTSEPTALLLLVFGLAGLAFLRKRNQ
ncbi:MAG TPA: PEP-CTERM sorting domain-containing protein [Sphingomonadales bacterium]|nr:PEP-CTERM sorting domain-containing protein [Sphingomonadales bacterium]